MALARYVVDALLVEGRSHREVARAHAASKSWVAKVTHGSEKVDMRRSRAPVHVPPETLRETEEASVPIRDELTRSSLRWNSAGTSSPATRSLCGL